MASAHIDGIKKGEDFDEPDCLKVSNGNVAVADPTELVCEKCSSPQSGKQGWCLRCGWHPRLRIHCELDPCDLEAASTQTPVSKVDRIRRFTPPWACKLVAGIGVILAVSIIARIYLPHTGSARFTWTVAQLVIGETVLMAGHLTAYLFTIMENDRLTFLDIILKPIAVWSPVLHSLPATFWRVALGAWGMSAVLSSFIVGGLADKDLMDWGGKPAHVNLMKAITEQAQQLAGDNQDGLENAIQDFAGNAAAKEPEKAPPPKPKIAIDCLIIGYEPDGENDFQSLILAAAVDGKLACVGTVNSGFTPEIRAQLIQRMRKLQRSEPFVPNRLSGKWLQPALACRVSAKQWSGNTKLVQPTFEELLDDINSGK